MKHLLWILALSLAMVACSKEEAVDTPDDDTIIADEALTDDTEQAMDDGNEPETDELQVVEESDAESEPTDEAIVLALSDDVSSARTWKFKEGKHYKRLVPTQPTFGTADKIEVAEAFMYSCPHCDTLESFVNRWLETKDPGVRFVRIPVAFNQVAKLHAQLYFTEEILARNGDLADQTAFRAMVFDEFHRRGNRLNSEASIQKLFARANVSEEGFKNTWNSFEVNQKLRVSADLERRYEIVSVPAVVVNGKYRVDVGSAGGVTELFEAIDELTVREGLR